MKLTALIPVLALLAAPASARDRHAHARQVERITNALEQREIADAMAAMQARVENDVERRGPRVLSQKPDRRFVAKRGASGCRVKGQNFTAAVTAATAATTATTAQVTTTQVAANDEALVQATKPSTTPAATTTTSQNSQNTAAATTGSSGSSGSSSGGGTTNSGANAGQLTPNGKKAGLSAGDALQAMAPHLGWWYNWAPTDEGTSNSNVQFVPMLWGGGSADGTDSQRLSAFQGLTSSPTWIIGPEEPDCASGSGSAGMTIGATAALWNTLMAPKGSSGSLLLSPSMCKQMAEDGWLAQFQTQISRDFDILNLHINKNSMEGVKGDLDYYYNKYNKPIWVTEFACVDDSNGFVPCTDQGQINQFINDIVDLFESDSRVYAYAFSNGYGLGDVWPAWSNGGLSQSGQTYLNAISKYH